MQLFAHKKDQYIVASLAALAFAVLIFLWMCLEVPTYPSPSVWALTAFAIYLPIVCLASVFRSLVTDVRTAPAKALNYATIASLSLARYSTGFGRALLWVAPSLVTSLQWAHSLRLLALHSQWHPSTNPQLE